MLRAASNAPYLTAWIVCLVLLWLFVFLWSLEREADSAQIPDHRPGAIIWIIEKIRNVFRKEFQAETKPVASCTREFIPGPAEEQAGATAEPQDAEASQFPERHKAILHALAEPLARVHELAMTYGQRDLAGIAEAKAEVERLNAQIPYDRGTMQTVRDFLQACMILVDDAENHEDERKSRSDVSRIAPGLFRSLHEGKRVDRLSVDLPDWCGTGEGGRGGTGPHGTKGGDGGRGPIPGGGGAGGAEIPLPGGGRIILGGAGGGGAAPPGGRGGDGGSVLGSEGGKGAQSAPTPPPDKKD